VHIDLLVTLTGLGVGIVVGLTGMGGGALMTPLLVLLFGVQPLAAVSSDLVAAFVMKPIGGTVHLRRGNVDLRLVRWLCTGSVPAAFGGVLLLRLLGDGTVVEDRLKLILGGTLLVAAAAMVAKARIGARRSATKEARPPIVVRPVPTLLIGALGGLVVGLTSVGSGSLIIVLLLVLYPKLTASELVGTDLVQAVPLVGAAAFGHLLLGDFQLGLTTSLLLGSIPGIYIGARWSAKAPDGVIRPILIVVLTSSALKLLGTPTAGVGAFLLAAALAGVIAVVYNAFFAADEEATELDEAAT
jgi:uncharacterized membrane protein YfcA